MITYIVSGVIALYGLGVLLTGQLTGFGSRSLRGNAARLLGLLLIAALPVALILGPEVGIILPVANKKDLESLKRETEISKEIIEQGKQLRVWREENTPKFQDKPGSIEETEKRLVMFKEFESRYRERIQEVDQKILALKEESQRLREEDEQRQKRREQSARENGGVWLTFAILLFVWAAVWVTGHREQHRQDQAQSSGHPQASPGTSAEERSTP